MPKYINADKILSHLNDEIEACGNPDVNNEPIAYGTKLGLLSAKAFIETAETVDVQEVRHGKWLTDRFGTERVICSICGTVYEGGDSFRFCPNCGAKMDGRT